MKALTLVAPSTFEFGEAPNPAPATRSGARQCQSLRHLRQRPPRHGRTQRTPHPADHHGPRGRGRDRGARRRRDRLQSRRPRDLRLHRVLRRVPRLQGGIHQPLQKPEGARCVLRRLPPPRLLRGTGRAAAAHPAPHPGRPALRKGRVRRTGQHRAPCREPRPETERRCFDPRPAPGMRRRRRRRIDRTPRAAGAQGPRLEARLCRRPR